MRRMSNIKFAGYGQSDHDVRECVLYEDKRQSVIKRTQICRQAGNSLEECRITVYRLRKYMFWMQTDEVTRNRNRT